jgi:nicotinamidase/pyrazinamidase
MTQSKALLLIDVQRDFCPGGALPAERGDEVVPPLNRAIAAARRAGLPIFASRDWHPPNSAHFQERGGLWPPHCVQGSPGAEFHPDLALPNDAIILDTGDDPEEDAGYSAFEGKTASGASLADELAKRGVDEIYIGGLATDYCVRASALDARKHGLKTHLLVDAVRGVDVNPGDSERAIREMTDAGVMVATSDSFESDVRTG